VSCPYEGQGESWRGNKGKGERRWHDESCRYNGKGERRSGHDVSCPYWGKGGVKKLRAQHAVKHVAPSKSSRKVSGFRVNPVTQLPCG